MKSVSSGLLFDSRASHFILFILLFSKKLGGGGGEVRRKVLRSIWCSKKRRNNNDNNNDLMIPNVRNLDGYVSPWWQNRMELGAMRPLLSSHQSPPDSPPLDASPSQLC